MKTELLSVEARRCPMTAWYSEELYHLRACSLLSNSNSTMPHGRPISVSRFDTGACEDQLAAELLDDRHGNLPIGPECCLVFDPVDDAQKVSWYFLSFSI